MKRRIVNHHFHNVPCHPPKHISCGHFFTKPGYHTIRDHGSNDWLLFYTLKGAGRIAFRGGDFICNPGSCVLLPQGTHHDYGISKDCTSWEFYFAHFIPWSHWYDLMNWHEKPGGLRFLPIPDSETQKNIQTAFKRMVQLRKGTLSKAELFAKNCLEEVLLWCDSVNPLNQRMFLDSRIRRAAEYICQNSERKISIEYLAKICGLSPSRLSHLYKIQMGQTPMRYLETQRIQKARHYLEVSSFSISEIASMVGYDSPFYFSRRFREHTGQSPRDYRKYAW
jgi:AraC family transcriptional regulator, arabinose operon regulatory protein